MRSSLVAILLLFCLLPVYSIGQTGLVRNINNKVPLIGATVYAIHNEQGTISDQSGKFTLDLAVFPDTLVVSYLGYQQLLVPVSEFQEELIIGLTKEVAVLPDIVVQAYREPARFSPERHTIIDFEIIDESAFLLIRASRKPYYRLRKTNLDGTLIEEVKLGNVFPRDGLFRSCLGGLYVLYEKNINEINYQSDSLSIGEQRNVTDYRRVLKPCLLVDSQYYYTGYHKVKGQIFTIYASKADTQHQLLVEVHNAEQIRRLSDEENFLKNKARTITGQANPEMRRANMFYSERAFAARVLYPPINIQLVRYQEQLFVFDFVYHQILPFSADLSKQQEVPFILHKRKPTKAKIIQDAITGKCYTITRDNKYSYVYELDPYTGIVNEAAVIPAIYLKEVKIQAGVLYYLHRGVTFEDRWQYLYSINIG